MILEVKVKILNPFFSSPKGQNGKVSVLIGKIITKVAITVIGPKRIRSEEKTFPAMKGYVNFIHACNKFSHHR